MVFSQDFRGVERGPVSRDLQDTVQEQEGGDSQYKVWKQRDTPCYPFATRGNTTIARPFWTSEFGILQICLKVQVKFACDI